MNPPKDYAETPATQPESVNVLMSKSVWLPIATGVVSNLVMKAQPYFEISTAMADALSAILAALAIAMVRRITSRPAHFIKPKQEG